METNKTTITLQTGSAAAIVTSTKDAANENMVHISTRVDLGSNTASSRRQIKTTDTFASLCEELKLKTLTIYTGPHELNPWDPSFTMFTVSDPAAFGLVLTLFGINMAPSFSVWVQLPSPLAVPTIVPGENSTPCPQPPPAPKKPLFSRTVSLHPFPRPQQVPAERSYASESSSSSPMAAQVPNGNRVPNGFSCCMMIPASVLESPKYKVDPITLRITIVSEKDYNARVRSVISTYNDLDYTKRRHAFAESMMHYWVNTGELNNVSGEGEDKRPNFTFDPQTIRDITDVETMIENRKKRYGECKYPNELAAAKRLKTMMIMSPGVIQADKIARRFGGVVTPTSGCSSKHNYNNNEPALMVVCPTPLHARDYRGFRMAERNLGNILSAENSNPTVSDLVECIAIFVTAFGESLDSKNFTPQISEYLKIHEPVLAHEALSSSGSPSSSSPTATTSTTTGAGAGQHPWGKIIAEDSSEGRNYPGTKKLLGIILRLELLVPESLFYRLNFAPSPTMPFTSSVAVLTDEKRFDESVRLASVPEFVLIDSYGGAPAPYTKDVKDAIARLSAMTLDQRLRLILWTQFYFVRSMGFNMACYSTKHTELEKKVIVSWAKTNACREAQTSSVRDALDTAHATLKAVVATIPGAQPLSMPMDKLRVGQIVVPVQLEDCDRSFGAKVPLLSLANTTSSPQAISMTTGETVSTVEPHKCMGADFIQCLAFMHHRLVVNGGLY